MEPTAKFAEEIREAWGNPRKMAAATFDEVVRHDELDLDYDGQIGYALQVGVMVGTMKDASLDEFIAAFTEQILNQG